MLRNCWFNTSATSRKDFLGVLILLLNAFTWYYMTVLVIDTYLKLSSIEASITPTVWIAYYGAVIASSIVGAIIPNTSRARFLYLWMSIGIICSFLPAFSSIPPQVWGAALGFAFGLGMPACLTYFADHSAIENRGKTGGIIFLSFSLSAALLAMVFTQLDFVTSLLLFAFWRGIGLLIFIPLRTSQEAIKERKRHVSFVAVLRDRSLFLYLVAWTMFILIDRFEWSLSGRNEQILHPSLIAMAAIGPILGSVAAFLGGILSDRVGRKKVAISGFVALGLAYAVPGLAPDWDVSWYIYLAVEGAAWGILFVTFLLTLWGDLSQNGGSEKYYVIGAVPYYFTGIMESILITYVPAEAGISTFSLASIFLFIAVLPLLFAPETLPEKKIEIRRLRGYLDQAKKLREKS